MELKLHLNRVFFIVNVIIYIKRGELILGIFSWMFSKNTERNSQVRKWVAQEIEKVDTTNPDVYAMFVGLIHSAVQCGKYSIEEQDEKISQVSKQYLGDATIFEIACYTYFRLENWLAKNQPQLKPDQIALPIGKWIVEKFSLTFYLEEEWVNKLFTEQLDRYKRLADAGKGVEEFHLELEQRILMTKGDKFDKKNPPQDASSVALDSQYIKRSLAKYEEYIAALMVDIQNYCNRNTKRQVSQGQRLEVNQDVNLGQKDYLYGMALVAQQDWIRACKAFTKVIDATPGHYDALVQRALLYLTLHQPVDALQDLTKAIEVNPSGAVAYFHRGKCYHRYLRQKDKALADYSEAIRLAPGDMAAYFGRGELYDEIVLYNEKQALEQNDHAFHNQISEEFLAAINDYSQVITLAPEHDGAYVNRGLAYARKARINKNVDFIEKSIADFERAISLNWENGYLYKQQDELKELLIACRM
ncbi:MAG: Tetratricopeptide 2 repeat-containing protein [Pelosinus sp.]|jgi:tetratricopeptide (TPR) repeat protein|nr:Tetratricopeptide 2 repeat-containing protein [Pelosinus sp.]